jgi:hypothetical protein
MGLLENLTKKRIQSIIKNKTGISLDIIECVPVIILNSGMSGLTKHGGDGWFANTSGGAYFVDNYIAINLEPITKIVDSNPVVYLTFNNNLELTIKPKHETARKVLLRTKTT